MNENKRAEYQAEEQGRVERILKGEAIVSATVETTWDRLQAVVLLLGDGRRVRFGYEAVYADDAWLDVDEVQP